jgi:hypothetical protein
MKTVNSAFKNPLIYLVLILVIGFAVRLYKIDNPVADWHSWRQADTAAVARNFYDEGYNPFFPKGDDMSVISELKPIPNLHRYRFVEFPIYNSLVYFGYVLNGGVDERVARLISIFFSLGSTIFIYLIVKRYSTTFHSLLSAFIFATLPFGIYYGRVILPEPSLVFFCLGMFYFLDLWIQKESRRLYFVGVFFTICAFLTKPMAIFFLLPLAYSYYLKEGFKFPPLRYFLFFIPALLPLFLWRQWIAQFPEGIPSSSWLLNGNGIRFRPAFFRWIVGDRLGREILSITGGFIFLLGFIVKPLANSNYLLHLLTVSSFAYLVVFATGNVQHDYYQYLLTPALSIFLARGIWLLMRGVPLFLPRTITIPLALFLVVITYYLTWSEIKGLYQVNNWAIVHAGEKADAILPKDAIVLAPYQGDSAFLYQINRNGFSLTRHSVEDMRRDDGVNFYISTSKDAKTAWLMQKYKTLVEDAEYIIVDLREVNPNFPNPDQKEPLN